MWETLDALGWEIFERDADIVQWAAEAKEIVEKKLAQKDFPQKDLRCGGTWFAGVNFLGNSTSGKLETKNLQGKIIASIMSRFRESFDEWDSAQISICYPGYPKPMASEGVAAFNYRIKKCAAHVDGILPLGNNRRRFVREHHAFIFGIPLSRFNRFASPLVIWEGSHHIILDTFHKIFSSLSSSEWPQLDVTFQYKEARKKVFATCPKKVIWVPLGGCFVLHRMCLHGISPWAKNAQAEPCGRIMAYFRPKLLCEKNWINDKI